MSKFDSNVINKIKLLSIDMIKEAGWGDAKISLSMAHLFYNLYLNHINFQSNNPKWINRDRVIVNNTYLPLLYSTLHMFGFDVTLDNLKEYKKFNSLTSGFANLNQFLVDAGSINTGDVISSSVGIALGERYLSGIIKNEMQKNEVINYHTYCICTIDDLMCGLGYESLSFLAKEKLNKLIIICNNDGIGKDSSTKETYTENLEDRFISLNFNYIEVKNGHSIGAINDAIEEAKTSKKPSIIILNTKYGKDSLEEENNNKYNLPLSEDDFNNLCLKYKLEWPINDTTLDKIEIEKLTSKRLTKVIEKWHKLKSVSIENKKVKEILEFLETKNFKINFNSENFKLNDNYCEELKIGNSKMFNVFASKSPFILSGSNDNFINTKTSISKTDIMSNDNKLGRNILFGNRCLAMGGIANGLATLGFKVFISSPLSDAYLLLNSIKYSSFFNLPVYYTFINDTFTKTIETNTISPYNEISMLRLIPNLVTFRPADINEIIGIYEILSNYKKSAVLIIGNEKISKLTGSNPKYVVAGAYRIKREIGEASGTIIATGEEVNLALQISEELIPHGIDLRVVSMPSRELFESQVERYKYTLIPYDLKTFVLEFGETKLWSDYASNDEYILGIKNYNTGGTKEELLNYYNLTKDHIKARIIELMKK